jgi:hypothetical protein
LEEIKITERMGMNMRRFETRAITLFAERK